MKKSKEYIGRRTENQTVSIEAEDEFLHCCIFAFAYLLHSLFSVYICSISRYYTEKYAC